MPVGSLAHRHLKRFSPRIGSAFAAFAQTAFYFTVRLFHQTDLVMAVGRGMNGFVDRQADMAGHRHFLETRQHIKGAVDCQWHHR